MALLTARHKMGAAALIMGLSILVSRFMGLLRDKVISWQFGASGETDIYFAAFVVPDFLNYLLAGGYVSITLIPILSRLFEQDEENAWRFFGRVFTWATLSIGTLSFLSWIFADFLAPVVAPGFDAEQLRRLTTFLRIVLPAQVCFLPGACLSAVLYIRNQFAVPALMPLVYNGCILLFGVGLPWLGLAHGMEGFCAGVVAGAFLGALVLPYLAVRQGGIQWRLGFLHPEMGRFLLLALPLMVGQSVVVLDEQFVRIFGSMAGDGAVSLLSYARRIMMVPVGIVAQAAGVASFPFLAGLLAKGDRDGFCATLNTALRNSLIVVMPIMLYMVAVAAPTLGFIFEGGAFTPEDTVRSAPLLQIMMLAVPFWVLQQVIGRGFYAAQDTLTPALVGTAATMLCIPLYWYAAPRYGAAGIAAVTTFSLTAYALSLVTLALRRFGRRSLSGLLRVTGQSVLLCTPAFGLALLCVVFLPRLLLSFSEHFWAAHILLMQFLVLSLSGILFGLAYLAAAKLFLPAFLDILLSPVRKRLKRHCKKQ